MEKIIHEAEIDIEKLAKYAAMAGLSAFAIKKLIKKYKREKTLRKFGKKSGKSDSDTMQDILVALGEAPWKLKGGGG